MTLLRSLVGAGALLLAAPLSANIQVTDDHPDDPMASPLPTNATAIFTEADPEFAGVTPPDGGCPSYHLHGFAFGHADPFPSSCGHGIVIFLSSEEQGADDAGSTRTTNPTVRSGGTHTQLAVMPGQRARSQRPGGITRKDVTVRGEDNAWLKGSLAAGDAASGLGLWANYSRTHLDSDVPSIAFDASVDIVTAGVDKLFSDMLLAGVAVGYENNDMETEFNTGESSIEGFTVAPYVGIYWNDVFSLDALIGYTFLDYEDSFLNAALSPVAAEHDGDRFFASVNFNVLHTAGPLVLAGQLGYLYVSEDQDGFVDSSGTSVAGVETDLGQLRIGGDVAYSVGALEPYGRVVYQYDATRDRIVVPAGAVQPDNDRDSVLVGLGLRWFGVEGVTINGEWNATVAHEDYDANTLSITVRIDLD